MPRSIWSGAISLGLVTSLNYLRQRVTDCWQTSGVSMDEPHSLCARD